MLVRIAHGDSELSLDIDPGWNVLFVKQRACQMLQLRFDEYDLLFNHRRLEEDDRFMQYQKIDPTPQENAAIICVPQLGDV
ncbi:hypothetical protein X801_05215 [Opisthorchis viverrini]|uniref:Ubiquitin-like domain-containing protein n=1 Tax=Opisthorchis viverrini TaxID=6198 RepID=A0A1S8WWS9_OPIVI|nr:hypothetical protein X801_05215 [Opisthorchis viverrini]